MFIVNHWDLAITELGIMGTDYYYNIKYMLLVLN